jgi:hypothetical protein
MRSATDATAMIDFLAIAFFLAEYPSQLRKTLLVPQERIPPHRLESRFRFGVVSWSAREWQR